MSKKYVWLLLGVGIMSSCVTNQQIQYLQKDDVNVDEVPLDIVTRTYNIVQFDYKIQPQDILLIRIQSLTGEEFDLFSKFFPTNIAGGNIVGGNAAVQGELVDENGEIELPAEGKVKVAGLNVFEAQEKLRTVAAKYVDNPVVRVRLMNFRFTILGEVTAPGTHTTFNNRTSIPEAIGMSGGLTDLGDRSKVKLIRQKGSVLEVQYINLLDEKFVMSPFYYINQNDVLIVPPLKQRPFRRYFGQNLGLFLSSLSLILFILNLVI